MPEDLVPGGSPEDPNYRKPPGGVSVSLSEIESLVEGNPKNDTPFAGLNDQLAEAAKEANPLPEDEPDSDKGAFNP